MKRLPNLSDGHGTGLRLCLATLVFGLVVSTRAAALEATDSRGELAAIPTPTPPQGDHGLTESATSLGRVAQPPEELDATYEAATIRPFVATFFGKERLVHDQFHGGRCAALNGVKGGLLFDVAPRGVLEASVGVKPNLRDDHDSSVFFDLSAQRRVGRGFIGGGISAWDLTLHDSRAIALLVQAGTTLGNRRWLELSAEGRLPLGRLGDFDNNYQFWAGLRIQRPRAEKCEAATCAPKQTSLSRDTARHRTFPVVPLPRFLTNNPVVMGLRFRGLANEIRRDGLSIGALKLKNLAKVRIAVVGTRTIEGETLPVVSLRYPCATRSPAPVLAELGSMTGRVTCLRLTMAVRTAERAEDADRVFGYVSPGQLDIDVVDIKGIHTSSFAEPVAFTAAAAKISNVVPLSVRRFDASSPLTVGGELRLNTRDIAFAPLSATFEGEGNTLTASAHLAVPGPSVWIYFYRGDRLAWLSGSFDVGDLSLKPAPPHPINFGGTELTLAELAIKEALFAKDERALVPNIHFSEFKVDASRIDHKHGTLTGALRAPITVKSVDAQVDIRNIFEGIDLAHQRLVDMQIALSDISYDSSGTAVTGNYLDITVPKYTSDAVKDSPPETNAEASILLKDASVKQLDLGRLDIGEFSAALQGPTDKLNGRGTVKATLSDVHTRVPLDFSKLLGNCTQPTFLTLRQVGNTNFIGRVDIFKGEPRGLATLDQVALTLTPEYWRCDWDSNPIGFDLPSIDFAIDWGPPPSIRGPSLVPGGGPRIDIGKVHWVAQLQPIGGIAGVLAAAEIRFDKDGAKLCGGHALVAGPGLWAPSINPTFPDCGSPFCNIPRDIVNGVFTVAQAPLGVLLQQGAMAAVNAVGLFDVGLLEPKCRQ